MRFTLQPGPVGADVDSIAKGWYRFRKALSNPCLCGHMEYDHRGMHEPGCSFGGDCVCMRFRLDE